MKKLMIAMAIAGAVGFAQATLTDLVTFSEQEYTVGQSMRIVPAENAEVWAAAEADFGEDYYVTSTMVTNNDPNAVGNYLALDGVEKLERFAQAGKTAVDIDTGLYIDTLVKFTAAEEDPQTTTGDKICIWLKSNELDPTQCKLMVTAGFVYDDDGHVTPTNYETSVTIADGSWQRLRVKAIQNFDNDMLGDGFVIILGEDNDKTVVSVVGNIFNEEYEYVYELSDRASKYKSGQGSYSIFPSMVGSGEEGDGKIVSLGFSGSGAIDNVGIYEGDCDPDPGPGADDWKDPTDSDAMTTMSNQVASVAYPSLAGSALADANAANLTTWATANNIDFADVAADTTGDYVNAYLLNCDPDDVDTEDDDFQLTISFDAEGNPVVELTDEAKAKGYNVQPVIKGAQSVNGPWHNKTDGDTFFKAVLELPSAD